MEKSVIIIGGGVAGLAVGSYLQMSGFDTEIFEKQDFPGGLCTSWKRKDFLVDGCIRHLTGTSEGESSYEAWKHLIDMPSMEFFYPEDHCAVDDPEAGRVFLYSDADRLQQELLRIAPEDGAKIIDLVDSVRKFSRFRSVPPKPVQAMGMAEKTRMTLNQVPWSVPYNHLARQRNADFVKELKSPVLKRVFNVAFYPDHALISTVLLLALRHGKMTGYPLGGSLFLAKQLEKRYLSLGGTVHYNQPVERIEVIKDRVSGVVTHDGNCYRAGTIISAMDGYQTLFDLLGGKWLDKDLQHHYREQGREASHSALYVSIGIRKEMTELPHRMFIPVRHPFSVGIERVLDYLEVMQYSHDPISAPSGKTLLTTLIPVYDSQYWMDLNSTDPSKYKAEKQLVALNVVQALEDHFGGVNGNVEMMDVATPVTFRRFSGNWQGSIYGWNETPRISGYPAKFSIRDLENFYMTGHWVSAGGLNNVVMNGYHLAQLICHDKGKKFRVEGF